MNSPSGARTNLWQTKKDEDIHSDQKWVGKREFYPKFYFLKNQESGLTLKNHKMVLDAYKDGLWKKHPMRNQTNEKNMTWNSLRFNLKRDQWKKVIENRSFVDATITRNLGKHWSKDIQLAKEVVAYSDEDGTFNIIVLLLENWRKVK